MRDQLKQILRENLAAAIDQCRSIVDINSHTANVLGVNRVQDVIQAELEQLGFTVERVSGGEHYGDHLVAVNQLGDCSEAQAKPILLVGHADTAHPKDSAFQNSRTNGDRVEGPGGYDMKAGVVSILLILRALRELKVLERLPCTVLVVGDEEAAMPHSAKLHQKLAKACACGYVFESGRGDEAQTIITSRKGLCLYEIEVQGVSAHSGGAFWEGRNAVVQLSRIVTALSELSDRRRNFTCNVSFFEGGVRANTVPDLARAYLDIRFCSTADHQWFTDELEKILAQYSPTDMKVRYERGTYLPPMEPSPEAARMAERYAAMASLAGFRAEINREIIAGGSSASHLAAAGLPTIDGLGPFGGGAHTEDEWFSIESFFLKSLAFGYLLLDS